MVFSSSTMVAGHGIGRIAAGRQHRAVRGQDADLIDGHAWYRGGHQMPDRLRGREIILAGRCE